MVFKLHLLPFGPPSGRLSLRHAKGATQVFENDVRGCFFSSSRSPEGLVEPRPHQVENRCYPVTSGFHRVYYPLTCNVFGYFVEVLRLWLVGGAIPFTNNRGHRCALLFLIMWYVWCIPLSFMTVDVHRCIALFQLLPNRSG